MIVMSQESDPDVDLDRVCGVFRLMFRKDRDRKETGVTDVQRLDRK